MMKLLPVVGLLGAMLSMTALAADPQKKKDVDTTVRSVQGTVDDGDGNTGHRSHNGSDHADDGDLGRRF